MANDPAPLSIAPVVLPERYRRLVEWVVEAAGFEVASDQAWTIGDRGAVIPESQQEARRLLRSMLASGAKVGLIEHAAPVDQPISVQPIAGKLFTAYQVDGGHIQLAGCQLEHHLVCRCTSEAGSFAYYNGVGERLPDALVASIGLKDLAPRANTPEISTEQIADAIAAALAQTSSAGDAIRHVTLVQCRHATGKIRFTIGNVSWDLPFSGWANGFNPPPFVCPHTGVASFHVASTDDGRIVAAEELATCHRSGRRLLRNELVQCAVTGVYLLPEYVVHCPVTDEVVEQGALVECGHCRQLVSPHAIHEGSCTACRNLQPIRGDDLRWRELLAEHPGLAAWRRWRMAETKEVYILEGQGVWQRLFAVIDRRTMNCRYMATAGRWPAVWKEFNVEQMREMLGKNEK